MFSNNIKLGIVSILLSLMLIIDVHAAKPIDLSKQSPAELHKLMPAFSFTSNTQPLTQIRFIELNREIDSKNKIHVRVQQMYQDHPVWGGDAVAHLKQGEKLKGFALQSIFSTNNLSSMDGTVYQDLNQDLIKTPSSALSKVQEQQAMNAAINDYQQKIKMNVKTKNHQSKLIVYIDDNNKAHWSYLVSFTAPPKKYNEPPVIPTYILDAVTFHIDEYWDDIHTLENVAGGGLGGNSKIGQLVYDGLEKHLPSFNIQRDQINNICYLKNSDIIVKKYDEENPDDIQFSCKTIDSTHNNTYWNGDFDAVNGGYSPSNDAFYHGKIVKNLYQEWIGIPVLKNPDGSPSILTLVVHIPTLDNAYWDGNQMNFGDGDVKFYPLTSLEVTAHEISHGFTQQHSNLQYYRMSGCLNESFSDMASKAAEFYAFGKNVNWNIGSDITKKGDEPLRYMIQPSNDCKGAEPGFDCSIDNAMQYNNYINVHYCSGAYNRFFYILSTSNGWDTKKAFKLMAQANAYHWTSTTNFMKGACSVLKAADDLGYETKAIKDAFTAIEIDTSAC
ncbi:MAG: Zinc metalloprotease [uncultured bacterium]|nr:MAG: Zinc metalloprotease [uncultured bacterium]